jgi:hypothetical protein
MRLPWEPRNKPGVKSELALMLIVAIAGSKPNQRITSHYPLQTGLHQSLQAYGLD